MNQQQLQTSDKEPSAFSALASAAPQRLEEATAAQDVMKTDGHADVQANAELNAIGKLEQARLMEESPLIALLQKEAKVRAQDTRATLAWGIVFTTILVWTSQRDFDDYGVKLGLFCTMMIGMGLLMIASLFHRSHRRKRALTDALAQSQELSQIGSLIEATRVENTPVRNLAKHSLIRLLPTMQASDAHRLTEAHRNRLLWFLAISPNDKGYRDLMELFSPSARQRELDLRLAILKALEQVGGAKELPGVERLSRGLPSLQSPSKVPKEVIEAAGECLPSLQSRAGEQRASEQLLRASSAHDTPHDILLRPAEARTDTAPEQLLRASETS